MLVDERRQHVLALIQRDGRAIVGELSEQLGISKITIRKDLEYLQSRGLIQRSHGGALPVQSSTLFDPSLTEKQMLHAVEKTRIAAAAADLVSENQCIIIDSGTTTTAIAQALRRFKHLTIVTNAVNIAAELGTSDFEVILTGGTLRKNSFSLVGPLAEDVLQEIHADILFLGVDGFDPAIGLTTPNILESRVNRAMVDAATTVVAVCDSTKFGRHSLALIVPPGQIDIIITDSALDASYRDQLEKLGVRLILV
jgi:DeoR family transcriptional regulator, aga operon transcriptional repressor